MGLGSRGRWWTRWPRTIWRRSGWSGDCRSGATGWANIVSRNASSCPTARTAFACSRAMNRCAWSCAPALVAHALETPPAQSSRLSIADVNRAIESLARVSGPGSTGERRRLPGALFAQAVGEEQYFLAALLLGELRQGALEAVVLEAVRALAFRQIRVRKWYPPKIPSPSGRRQG